MILLRKLYYMQECRKMVSGFKNCNVHHDVSFLGHHSPNGISTSSPCTSTLHRIPCNAKWAHNTVCPKKSCAVSKESPRILPARPIYYACLITSKHAFDQFAQRSPIVLSLCQAVLINKEDVVLEACVEMWLKTELHDYGVVVAIDVSVDAVETLEHLSDSRRKGFGERNT